MTAAVLLAGCENDVRSNVVEQLAKCQLSALDDRGQTFRENYSLQHTNEVEPTPLTAGDASYREYMLLCMEAAGYAFRDPTWEATERGGRCWLPDSGGGIPDADVNSAVCYAEH